MKPSAYCVPRPIALPVLLGITAAITGLAVPGLAQTPKLQDSAAPNVIQGVENSPLPLRAVVLFSSGVGYFQHTGTVDGATNITLSFRAEQINDILKSLVLFDANGNVRPVTYTTKDSISRRLSAAGLDINGTITLGTLLRQFQGAMIRLTVRDVKGHEETVEGRILSVSTKPIPPAPLVSSSQAANADETQTVVTTTTDTETPQLEILNMLVTSGARPALRSVSLEKVQQVELLDDHLNGELQESLKLLATGLDQQRRTVQVAFGGNGSREVRAGYLEEMPIWKTSYRLVLDKAQKPYLQGWGIVENTTDEDWNDIHLSLVSGQPISFIQNLYQPLYIARPEVEPQVVGSPLPQTYGERIDNAPKRPTASPALAIPPVSPSANPESSSAAVAGNASKAGGGFTTTAPSMITSADGSLSASVTNGKQEVQHRREDIALSAQKLAQSIAAQAQGAERGDLFEYAISQPVTLPRQQAAMVPIVSQSIDGERVSIYDPASSDKRALNGFRLKNTTGLHLSGGPITVFQEGGYAGDAQINSVQPGEDRLISYAVDLDLVVDHKQPEATEEITALSIKKGVLFSTQKQRQVNLYNFRNKSDAAKTVLVQQAIQPEWVLAAPATPAEKTADQYRFKVEVPASKTAELKVVTEHPQSEEVALLDESLDTLIEYVHNTQVSPQLRASLVQIVERRRKLGNFHQQLVSRENEIKTIDHEQSRIRQNMAQLNRTNPLYLQYVKKLTWQEARIEKLRQEIVAIRARELNARQELTRFTDSLSVG
ncbi:MAG: hypothetical protein JO316_08745 [Abitibacteriaceae bacterium]|nr:hypothetical protein [Abditibacteriaceae bacterium]MBV9865423.1 hypothetical protein [Abditibacteriaceae bacterium]